MRSPLAFGLRALYFAGASYFAWMVRCRFSIGSARLQRRNSARANEG